MSDVVITVKLLLERDMRRQTRQTKTQMWHINLHPTPSDCHNIHKPPVNCFRSQPFCVACGGGLRNPHWSATDLKHISCDRDNLTRSVWHSWCYHTDTKSRARRCSPFKTVCIHMVTVPGWQGFQCVTWALPKHIRTALSAASTGLWIPAPGGQLSLSTHVWQSSGMKHGFVLALGL